MALAIRIYERLLSYAPPRLAASLDYFLVPGLRRASDGPLFFYLDAHWDADAPVREELRIIAGHRPDVVMMIDDFCVPDDAGYGFDAQYGPGKRLTMEDTGLRELKGMEIFWPAARSSEETGERRGCVVLASVRAIQPLKALV